MDHLEPRPEPQPSPAPAPVAPAAQAQAPTAPAPLPVLSARERRWLEIVLTLGSIALFFVVLGQLAGVWAVFSDLILTFFFAWLLGFVLEPIAGWLARFMPRVIAVAIAYGAVAIAAFGLVVVAASALLASISDFLGNLPQFQQDLVALVQPDLGLAPTSLGFDRVDLAAQVETLLGTLAAQAQNLLGPLQDVAVASIGFVGNVLIVFFLAVFISIDRADIGSFLLRLVPPAYSREAHLLTESVGRSFGGFIRGMVVIGGSYALVALLCNLVLGLDYAALTTSTLRRPHGDPVLRALRRLGTAGDRGGGDQARRPRARRSRSWASAGSSTRTSSSRGSWPAPSASTRSWSSPPS